MNKLDYHPMPAPPPPPPPPPACIFENMKISSAFECDSELLVEKLTETESHANRIVHQLSLMKDFLLMETSHPHQAIINSSLIIKRFEADRNHLLRQLELYEFANRDLRDIVHSLKSHKSITDIRQLQENSSLIKQIDAVEQENNVIHSLKVMKLNFTESFFCLVTK